MLRSLPGGRGVEQANGAVADELGGGVVQEGALQAAEVGIRSGLRRTLEFVQVHTVEP